MPDVAISRAPHLRASGRVSSPTHPITCSSPIRRRSFDPASRTQSPPPSPPAAKRVAELPLADSAGAFSSRLGSGPTTTCLPVGNTSRVSVWPTPGHSTPRRSRFPKSRKLRIGFAAQYVDVVDRHVTVDLQDEIAPLACFTVMVKTNHLQSRMATLEFLEDHLLDLGPLLRWLGRHRFF